ncbi:hypothetical protein DSECCO2_213000 [anaerobic digester metagenome]
MNDIVEVCGPCTPACKHEGHGAAENVETPENITVRPAVDADLQSEAVSPAPFRVVHLPVSHIPTPRRWRGRVVNQDEIDEFNERYMGCLIKPVYAQE